ncbi:LLM class flavin-dependent oxidoreductase [Ureibacillus chungkukjangi]|uniref:LLM class flavin-dependent oxidoreductase n=1 Tax=Ureibacillus chungkukjangi TaxID=1202712 RepID=UPI00203F4710|nr:LLM class flavin-dependent oxidoreductase [Ureibacillus chungkukjangi]MCM3389909.1 LLM class flavin-dependent oxidoreductase [Ureibacillus chungkukjangi]
MRGGDILLPKLSVLDLAPVLEGSTPAESFQNSRELIQAVESYGYNRYWVAEHHNMQGIASSATAVLIGYLAASTNSIRVGAGGIMLPNHAPLMVAEQFGTLESMYPGRIDLGLGRAPGSDMLTARALRRDDRGAYEFDRLVDELRGYFEDVERPVIAVPGKGMSIPIWLLGSSLYSAQLAGQLGLPYSFASHFAPDLMDDAIATYTRNFKPSDVLEKPYVMVAVNAIIADTDDEAEFLASTLFQQFLGIIQGKRGKTQPPRDMSNLWTEDQKKVVHQQLKYTFYGSSEKVYKQLAEFMSNREIDELMINSPIYNIDDRKKSYELLSKVWK